MQYVKLPIKQKSLNSTEYYNAVSSGPQVQEPELWELKDDSMVLVMPDRMSYLFTGTNKHYFDVLDSKDDAKAEIVYKPQSQGIDSATLLKAIAIAQDPTLALNLIKE